MLPVIPAQKRAAEGPLRLKLTNVEARATILTEELAALPGPIGRADVSLLAVASHGLTGVDLKAVVEHGQLAYAYDVAGGRAPRPVDDYFFEAIETVRQTRHKGARRQPEVTFSAPARTGFLVDDEMGELAED